MNTFKGTPGRWSLIGKQGTAIWAGDEIIGNVTGARAHHASARANAALMAQAPAMLEVLLQLHSNDLTGSERIEPILTALRDGGAL